MEKSNSKQFFFEKNYFDVINMDKHLLCAWRVRLWSCLSQVESSKVTVYILYQFNQQYFLLICLHWYFMIIAIERERKKTKMKKKKRKHIRHLPLFFWKNLFIWKKLQLQKHLTTWIHVLSIFWSDCFLSVLFCFPIVFFSSFFLVVFAIFAGFFWKNKNKKKSKII